MLNVRTLLFAVAVSGISGVAHSETLVCTGGSVSEGDSRLSLLYKCGPPVLSDAACSPVYFAGTHQRVPDWVATHHMPCQPSEKLLYERGPGNLLATVGVRSGVVRSITYSRQAR